MGFKYRKLRKTLATGHFSDRDVQFKIIFQLTGMMILNYPVISIDCKKKENLGTLYREGKCYSTDSVAVFIHDYPSLKIGKVVPHGIYDMQRNCCFYW